MRFFSSSFVTLVALATSAVKAQDNPWGSSQDPSSYANVDEFAPAHVELDYAINFDDSTTSGTVIHTLTVLEAGEGITTVYFDIWDAVEALQAEFMGPMTGDLLVEDGDVSSITRQGSPDEFVVVDFEVTTPNPNIGNALATTVPPMMAGDMFQIRFTYKSLPGTTALSWLTPEQTAAKTMPFVYSLCQMNFCRDWFPIMDTPSQKITYNATILAPTEFVVSMSGNETSKEMYNETHSVTQFECNLKIPSYQIAMIVGDLVQVALSDRVIIFAEEPYIDRAVAEFEDMPAILDMCEEYLTPYIWGVYSVFIMPPSFPWGGMEHVNANQVSMTLLPGDKSMLDTAIHEITHSWFGNDVGCQNWDNFWINEGVNSYVERKILGRLFGEDYMKIDYYTANVSMVGQMESWYGLDDSYSSLFPDIGDDDPENSFSDVPYDKGSMFMYYIEQIIGEDAMQALLRGFLAEFSQQAINAPMFKEWYESFIMDYFPDNATEVIELTMWDTWVYEPGLIPVDLDFSTQALEDSIALARSYLELGGTESPEAYEAYFEYFPIQKAAFVQEIADSDMVDAAFMEFIDSDLNITLGENNPNVKTDWYVLGIEKKYEAVIPRAYQWCVEQGRSAFARPIFAALIAHGYCPLAQDWYDEFGKSYNSYVEIRIARNLEACEEGEVVTDGEEVETDAVDETVGGSGEAREPVVDQTEPEDASAGAPILMSFVAIVSVFFASFF